MIHLQSADSLDPACNVQRATPQIAVSDFTLVDCPDCLLLPHPGVEHSRKCWPDPFTRHLEGRLQAEHRWDAPRFRAGDTLFLREWDPETADYTGRALRRPILDVQRAPAWGLRAGYAVLSLGAVEVVTEADA